MANTASTNDTTSTASVRPRARRIPRQGLHGFVSTSLIGRGSPGSKLAMTCYSPSNEMDVLTIGRGLVATSLTREVMRRDVTNKPHSLLRIRSSLERPAFKLPMRSGFTVREMP